MPKYVDIEALQKALYDEDAITFRGLALISRFPVADVVPVVRCRDCCYAKDDTEFCKKHHFVYCSLDGDCTCRELIDYCSYGERRMDAQGKEDNDDTERTDSAGAGAVLESKHRKSKWKLR